MSQDEEKMKNSHCKSLCTVRVLSMFTKKSESRCWKMLLIFRGNLPLRWVSYNKFDSGFNEKISPLHIFQQLICAPGF